MNWILISFIAYFLVALEVILDKFLLTSKRVSHPAVYAFYSGMLSLSAFLLFPFGFHFPERDILFFGILAGIIFVYGILSLFYAINRSEASQVMPVVGATSPLFTLILSVLFLGEKLTQWEVTGVFLLILGGLLISFEFPLKINRDKFFSGFYYSVIAGVLLAIAFTWFKSFFERDGFIPVFIWTRVGLFAGALSLLLFPFWRRHILASFRGARDSGDEKYRTGGLFIFNKVLGGTGSILTNYAIKLGSVTIVNALVSLEYVFVFFFGIIFSFWFPTIFKEQVGPGKVIQKILSILIITAGIVLVAAHIKK
jgi:drug/metabolite transporter (DMT)-like permease